MMSTLTILRKRRAAGGPSRRGGKRSAAPGPLRRATHRFLVAPHALELQADARRSPLRRGYPLAHLPWRIVPYVLAVTAAQLGHPVSFLIPMVADDGLLHRPPPGQSAMSPRSPADKAANAAANGAIITTTAAAAHTRKLNRSVRLTAGIG